MKKINFLFVAVLLLAIALCGQTTFAQKTAKSEAAEAENFMRVELEQCASSTLHRIAETVHFANFESI